MDTSEASSSKRNTRLNITKQYDARVTETTKKVDPFRAKANEALKTRAQRLINLEIPVLVRSLKSSNVELG